MIHFSIPNYLYFFKPLLPYYTWVNLACTNHWLILTSSQSFHSVLSLGIKFMILSCLTCMDLVESLLLLLLSCFSHVRLCVTPQMAAQQAPPSLGFSRQEYRNGLPFPSPMHESER